jgi:dephospho-CoA kinase
MVIPLEQVFPSLAQGGYKVTSAKSSKYNCVAWALNGANQWWWPVPDVGEVYWPRGAPMLESLSAFQTAFAY